MSASPRGALPSGAPSSVRSHRDRVLASAAGARSHLAVGSFARDDHAFIITTAGSAIGRIVLLAGLDDLLRREPALAATIATSCPATRRHRLRSVLREHARRRRVLLDDLVQLEILHRAAYDAGVDSAGTMRADTVRDSARASYARLYPRMVNAVAHALLDGDLDPARLRNAVAGRRWPSGLPHSPALEGQRDLIDEIRHQRSSNVSVDQQLAAVDDEDQTADPHVLAKLSTHLDAPVILSRRDEVAGRLQVAVAEYDALKEHVSPEARAQTRRILALLLGGHDSRTVSAMLETEGYAPILANTIDQRWGRTIGRYEILPDILSRQGSHLGDTVWLLEQLSAQPPLVAGEAFGHPAATEAAAA